MMEPRKLAAYAIIVLMLALFITVMSVHRARKSRARQNRKPKSRR
jgi:hypothetical protein